VPPAAEVLNRVMIIMARFITWALVSLIVIATVASLLDKPLMPLVDPVYAEDHYGSAVVEEVGSEFALPGATVRASKRSPSDRADRSTIQSPRARARSQKRVAFFEGDTGFEPVTSSVSAGFGRREMGSARRLEVRDRPNSSGSRRPHCHANRHELSRQHRRLRITRECWGCWLIMAEPVSACGGRGAG
jgi:hypothetical protein